MQLTHTFFIKKEIGALGLISVLAVFLSFQYFGKDNPIIYPKEKALPMPIQKKQAILLPPSFAAPNQELIPNNTTKGFGISFDGVDDYLDWRLIEEAWNPQHDFSIEFWAKPAVDYAVLLSATHLSEEEEQPAFFIKVTNGKLAAYDGNQLKQMSFSPINDGQWHHIVYVKENQEVSLFLDGYFIGKHEVAYTIAATRQYYWGGRLNKAQELSELYKGQIDELQIWQGSRTPEAIRQDMFCKAMPSPDLIAYLPFEKTTHSFDTQGAYWLQDFSENDHHILLRNFDVEKGEKNPLSVADKVFTLWGDTTICAGETALFSLPAWINADQQQWILPEGWTGHSNSSTIEIIPNAESAWLRATAETDCGTLSFQLELHPIDFATNMEKTIEKSTALVLDGIDDYIELPTKLAADLSSYTIETRFKLNTYPESHYHLFDFGKDWDTHFYLSLEQDSLFFYIKKWARPNIVTSKLAIAQALQLGQWHHVAVTYEEDSQMGRFYFNGQLLDQQPLQLSPKDMEGFKHLFIGRSAEYKNSIYFHGQIDEFRIWNVARTKEEIQNFMYQYPPCSSNLLAYFPFENAAAKNRVHIEDFSLNENDGVLMIGNSRKVKK